MKNLMLKIKSYLIIDCSYIRDMRLIRTVVKFEIAFFLFAIMSCANDGARYARERIEIHDEQEWSKSRSRPGSYNSPPYDPKNPNFYDLKFMNECAQWYIKDHNISGIRCTFLMAYTIANLPIRSGDIMSSYSEPLYDLLMCLGDESFASSLSKMRPEVQSSVIYILFMSNIGDAPSWKSNYPRTAALADAVNTQIWPHDIE